MQKTTISEVAQGFRKRTLVTARLAAKVGLKALGKNLGIKGKPDEVDEAAAVEAAKELASKMGEMKGLIMKFGQMASYLEGLMPPAAQRVLAQLQAQSTPLTFDAARGVVEGQLGAPVDELFDGFAREPFAAASLGQVHRAMFDGTPVAVKVQYPHIADVLKSDLRTVGAFARMGTLFSAVDGGGLIAELQDRVNEECDYENEAANQEMFRRLVRDIDGADVPRVVRKRSALRVLTSELSGALPFQRFADEAAQAEKDRAASVIFNTCMTTIFRHCVFNADPHPGNYLFTESGNVVFLDFGCVKRFSEEHIDDWKALALCLLDNRRDQFEDACRRMGLGGSGKFDWDYQWNMMRFIYEPFLTPGYKFTKDYVKRSYDVLMFDNPDRFRMKFPPDALFKNRLQWGLYSVLASLDAQADWGGLLRHVVESPTTPVHKGGSQ